MTFEIPHIRVKAKYQSSGVLILMKASGAGDYWGEYGNILLKIKYEGYTKEKRIFLFDSCWPKIKLKS